MSFNVLTFRRDRQNRVAIVREPDYSVHQTGYPRNDTMPHDRTSQLIHSVNKSRNREKLKWVKVLFGFRKHREKRSNLDDADDSNIWRKQNTHKDQRDFAIMWSKKSCEWKWKENSILFISWKMLKYFLHTSLAREKKWKILRLLNTRDWRLFFSQISSLLLLATTHVGIWNEWKIDRINFSRYL